MWKKIVIVVLLLTSPALAADLKIGMNLAGPCDWSTEWPFVNIMKYGRTWITYNHEAYTGDHPWDTGLADQIPVDEDGYPLQVPFAVEGADTLQMVKTVWAAPANLPAGDYIFLYDGEGTFDFWGDATIIQSAPGRLVVEVDPNPESIITLEIHESNPDNHVRHIRFLLPGTETTYETQPWCDIWLEKLAPFSALRFMDWGTTNNNPLETWDQRSHVTDFTYARDGGVPYEWWIELCNMKRADAWVCVPHRADENYVTQMATLFRDNLDPNLKIYVEYSNEVWNWIFDQAHYGLNELDPDLAWPERLAPRIAEVMQTWTDVFGAEANRLVRVQGCQHGWYDIGHRIFMQMVTDGNDHLIDALSPAGYMSPNHEQLAALGAAATPQDVITGAAGFTFNPAGWLMEGWLWHAQLAADYNKKFIYYEGGQHFTPEPWGTVQPYNPALMGSQVVPEMYDLYMQLFETLEGMSEDEQVFMHFSFIADLWGDPHQGAYGNFGALTSQFYQFPPYDEAPKYRALMDYMAASQDVEDESPNAEKASLSQNFPNPFTESSVIRFHLSKPQMVKLDIFNTTGQLLKSLVHYPLPSGTHEVTWDGQNETGKPVGSGVYFYRLQTGNRHEIKQMLYLK